MRKSAVILAIFLGISVQCEPLFAEVESPDVLLEKVCSQCHSLKQTLARTKTKTRWKKSVDRCRHKLAVKNADTKEPYLTINDEEAERLVTYLYSKWGYKSEKADTDGGKKREKLLEQFTPTKVDVETEGERKKRLQKKFTPSATTEDRRKKLLKKFTPSKARIEDSEVKRKKLLEKLSVSETSASKAEARRKELKEKFSSSDASKSAAEDRRKKFREKFQPQKARTVSPTSRTAKEKTE